MKKFNLASLPLAIAGVLGLTSCAALDGYQFGDLSTRYCGCTSPEVRATLKVLLETGGISIGVDYCSAKGLVDVLAGVDK